MKKVYRLKESLREILVEDYGEEAIEKIEDDMNFLIESKSNPDVVVRFKRFVRRLSDGASDMFTFSEKDFAQSLEYDPNGWNVWPLVDLPALENGEFFLYIPKNSERPFVCAEAAVQIEIFSHRQDKNFAFAFKVINVDEEVFRILKKIGAGGEHEES